ncbi:MAG: biotin-dependent carboxyltransferase family protein [Campylobacterota bacterium]|nr:biotin-dependent carboxyltransferase family protein [Campylobacterota bacterium]
MSGFEVINSGIFTLIQDRGRFSYTHLGLSNSGIMDEYAAFIAHKLLDNPMDTNLLEIAFSHVVFKATSTTSIAITGARCEFFINDIALPLWQTYEVHDSDIIKIGKILEGQRVYIAVKNGFDIPKEFGSNATSIKESLGGLDGKKISSGHFIPYTAHHKHIIQRLQQKHTPSYDEEILTLRVVLSYQHNSFTQEEKDIFFSSTYTISRDFNAMGCKLDGPKIQSCLKGIISEGIAYGAIQIPPDGQPIILLKDRQTIGGYPKIGSVLHIDCFKLAQRKVNTKVQFEPIDIEFAQEKLKEFYKTFR